MLRRVVGASMAPMLRPGQLLFATPLLRRLKPGQVVVVRHMGRDKVKRVERLEPGKLFVIGDNLEASTDSRHYGWLPADAVVGRVIWPKLTK